MNCPNYAMPIPIVEIKSLVATLPSGGVDQVNWVSNDQGVRFVELNGDGLVDVVCSRINMSASGPVSFS